MKLVEAYLQEQGFTVEMCNIYTRGVDYYESYKRVIMCAYKDDLLLCIRARSGVVSDPFVGDDEQIELKLQEPALKLLSCIRSLNMGADPVYCEKFEKMMAIPIIIMEKSSRKHPLYYYFDEETRESKLWYVKKNVVYLPWEWIKEFWNEDFELSLRDQGYDVSPPVEYQAEQTITQAVKDIEEMLASRRIGILKSVYLNKPTLPPLVLTLTQTDQMMIFLVDEPDEDIHPKLMDFAVYYFGPRTEKFPTTIKAIFFNIITKDSKESYLQPYIPKDNDFVEKHFEHPTVIKTTVNGFKQLLEVADIEEIPTITKLSPIPSMEFDELLKVSSGYWFSKVFQEAKKRLKTLFSAHCPFCSNSMLLHQLPATTIKKLKFNLELTKENSYLVFCDNKKSGCGWGVIIIKDEFQGGVHGFFIGRDQQYVHESDSVKLKLEEIGLIIQSMQQIKPKK
jgi:hypothetical protein